MKTRKKGYYWVKRYKRWRVMFWDGSGYWYDSPFPFGLTDKSMDKIDERRIKRNKKK